LYHSMGARAGAQGRQALGPPLQPSNVGMIFLYY